MANWDELFRGSEVIDKYVKVQSLSGNLREVGARFVVMLFRLILGAVLQLVSIVCAVVLFYKMKRFAV